MRLNNVKLSVENMKRNGGKQKRLKIRRLKGRSGEAITINLNLLRKNYLNMKI